MLSFNGQHNDKAYPKKISFFLTQLNLKKLGSTIIPFLLVVGYSLPGKKSK